MKLTRYYCKRHPNEPKLGIRLEEGLLDVSQAAARRSLSVPKSMNEILVHPDSQLKLLENLLIEVQKNPDVSDYVTDNTIHYLPMSANPEKIICVGMNYTQHAAEVVGEIPTVPVFFNKYNNALSAHLQDLPLPTSSEQMDYEAELVVVIGKEGENIPYSRAYEHIFGYTCGNDLTARDLQFKTSQWMIGKTLNYSAPTGPVIVTKDEIADPMNLRIQLSLNGEMRQDGNTSDMLFTVPYLVSYISQYIPLKPGDLIFTSTPKGVIAGAKDEDKRWLLPNDEIEITIEGIGTLKNRMV